MYFMQFVVVRTTYSKNLPFTLMVPVSLNSCEKEVKILFQLIFVYVVVST